MQRLEFGIPLIAKRVVNKIGRPFGVNPFPRAFPNPLSVSSSSRAAVFDRVFHSNFWGSAQSRSGLGSEEAFASRYRLALAGMLARRSCTVLFDAPCGDLNWMAGLAQNSPWKYRGGDISALLIEAVKVEHPGLDFQVFDICEDSFPDADFWHCRDCLFHLPFDDIKRALRNFAASTIPYALLTTHRARLLHKNLDVTIGGFRYVDLERPPISLPRPEEYLVDYRLGLDFPRYVGVWSRESILKAAQKW